MDEIQEVTFDERQCSKCGIVKPYDQFSFSSRTPSDRRSGVKRKKAACKACDSRSVTAYYRRHGVTAARAQYRKEYYIRKYRKHGIDEAFARTLSDPEARIGPCPICHEVERLVLDHDHASNKLRELICSNCNGLLGFANDSIDTLYNAVAYLKRHRGV